MSYQSARIDSPDIIKDFRSHLIEFGEIGRQSVDSVKSDVHRTIQWLQHDQLQHWKEEFRKADERVRQARSAYLLARFGADALRKPSYVEEQKALRKAEQRKEEAERKITAVKKWSTLLNQQAEKMMGPISKFSSVLEHEMPKSLAKLDSLIESLEEYLRTLPPSGA